LIIVSKILKNPNTSTFLRFEAPSCKWFNFYRFHRVICSVETFQCTYFLCFLFQTSQERFPIVYNLLITSEWP